MEPLDVTEPLATRSDVSLYHGTIGTDRDGTTGSNKTIPPPSLMKPQNPNADITNVPDGTLCTIEPVESMAMEPLGPIEPTVQPVQLQGNHKIQ